MHKPMMQAATISRIGKYTSNNPTHTIQEITNKEAKQPENDNKDKQATTTKLKNH